MRGANYGAFRFTRIAGPTPDAPDVYSPVQEGWVSPGKFEAGGRPIWAPLPIATGRPYATAATLRRRHPRRPRLQAIRTCWCSTASSRPNPSIRCSLSRKAALPGSTPAKDARARARRAVALRGGERARVSCSARRSAPLQPNAHRPQFAYLGGGFGGRDHTPFPLYVALAAMFFPGRPVRLAHDRYQQFQAGMKRHAFKMQSQIGIDRATRQDHRLRGRPRPRRRRPRQLFGQRRGRGATGAIGIYDVPKVDVTTVAVHSRGVTAGSMRGYGTLQTMTALEVLIDEAAAALPLDPIEFRRRNALKTGGRTMTGNPYRSRSARRRSSTSSRRIRSGSERARPRKRGAQRPASWSGPASPASPRTTAPAPIARSARVEIDRDGRITDPWRRGRDGQRHRHGAGQPRRAASRRRRRRGDRVARSTASTRSGSSPPATPTR